MLCQPIHNVCEHMAERKDGTVVGSLVWHIATSEVLLVVEGSLFCSVGSEMNGIDTMQGVFSHGDTSTSTGHKSLFIKPIRLPRALQLTPRELQGSTASAIFLTAVSGEQ